MRTVPASILARSGQNNIARLAYLVEWDLPGGTQYFCSGPAVTWSGNTFQGNMIDSITSLQSQFIDRKTKDFQAITINFINLPLSGVITDTGFPLNIIDAAGSMHGLQCTVVSSETANAWG